MISVSASSIGLQPVTLAVTLIGTLLLPGRVQAQNSSKSTIQKRPSALVRDRGRVVVPANLAESNPEFDHHYKQAQVALRELRNEDALASINEALRVKPDSGAAYGLRSGILGNLKRFKEGFADADRGIRLASSPRAKAAAAYNKGFNLQGLKRNEEALKAYHLAIQFDPTYARGHFGRGKLYCMLGMWAQSKRDLDKAIEADPKLAAAWAYRAHDLYALGHSEEGLLSAEAAILLAPKDHRGFRARAVGYEQTKRYDEMLADATTALELDPTQTWAHLLRGRALGFLNRLDEALAEYRAEPDQRRAKPYITGINEVRYGDGVDLCGNLSTEYDTPTNITGRELDECIARIMQQIDEWTTPAERPSERKRPGLPGHLPVPKRPKKLR